MYSVRYSTFGFYSGQIQSDNIDFLALRLDLINKLKSFEMKNIITVAGSDLCLAGLDPGLCIRGAEFVRCRGDGEPELHVQTAVTIMN